MRLPSIELAAPVPCKQLHCKERSTTASFRPELDLIIQGRVDSNRSRRTSLLRLPGRRTSHDPLFLFSAPSMQWAQDRAGRLPRGPIIALRATHAAYALSHLHTEANSIFAIFA
jgi:hypothetical protein